MRTITALDTALLNSPCQAFRVWIKVELERASATTWGSETWVDMTDLNGFDWVKSVDYGESIDTPAWTATVRLHSHLTDNPNFTLSPFITDSINNTGGVLIQPYRKIRISTAIVPVGDPRALATFNVVFLGRIDSYTMKQGEIEIRCRDRTGELLDFFVETETEYGSDTPSTASNNDLEDLLQDILDNHYNTTTAIGGSAGSPYTLYSAAGTSGTPFAVADATGWSLRRFEANKSPVWQWCQRLSDMIGYQLRMRWHEGSGIDDFVLVLEEPDRAASTADFTLDPTGGIVRIDSVALSAQGVRNFWRVGYALNGGEAASVSANNSASQTKYGRRFAEIQEGSSSQIDTATEAQAMADALLADTKEPTARVQLTAPYLWFAQLNDLVGITADTFYFASDQKLAILSRRNTIQQGGPAQTVLVCEGLPKAGKHRHVQNQRQYPKPRPSPNFVQSSINYGGLLANATFGDIGRE